jgi:dinuclear metal center YbgI/SA1388 family protein
MATVAGVVQTLGRRYPAALASGWDSVGLVCGEPAASVHRILLAVDPVIEVVDEALAVQADLVVTHHPLFLSGVHSIAADEPRGRVVHQLISHGIALYAAHTNADHADPGVSDALARAIGLTDLRPLVADAPGSRTGVGRVGTLAQPETLLDLAVRLAELLPPTHHGVRVAGDPSSAVRTVAVCGGSGAELLDVAAGAVDAYITSDLKHHRTQDHRAAGGCGVLDIAHWAGEWLWLPVLAAELSADLGSTVEVLVSRTCTDPWTAHVRSPR